jgi:murein DD-endopeptidase MepM/ murein hydrolase activator NlpD
MNKQKAWILTHFGDWHRPKLRLPWIIALGSLPFLGMVAAFGTAPNTSTSFVPTRTVVESLNFALPDRSDDANRMFWHEERFGRGDTISGLLQRLGVNDADARAFLRQFRTGRSLRLLRPGTTVQARTAEDGSLLALRYITNKGYLVGFDKQGAKFNTVERQLTLSPQREMKSGEINSSLFAATDAAGIPDNVATQMADVFGGDIDFRRDLRHGDRFTVIYQMYYHDGRPIKSGRLLAAEFVNRGESYRAIWYQDAAGKGGYYTPDGKNLHKAFLRSPLAYSRISSGFTMRFDPYLHKWRKHEGVDYAAPIGTPVKAVADGIVAFVGKERGYGNIVILDHQRGISTRYAHLSRFAPGLHRGTRVHQGEVIGKVGESGWATGPHLHYEFRVNNKVRDPLTVALPGGQPIPPQQLAAFNSVSAPLSAELNLFRNTNLALSD